jgi:hypothetical protein
MLSERQQVNKKVCITEIGRAQRGGHLPRRHLTVRMPMKISIPLRHPSVRAGTALVAAIGLLGVAYWATSGLNPTEYQTAQSAANADSGSASASAQAQLPTPVDGWFAGQKQDTGVFTFTLKPTDPVNLVLSDPNGHASDVLQAALKASGTSSTATGHWYAQAPEYQGGCYDPSVLFATDLKGTYNPPDTVYATDTSDTGDPLNGTVFRGCGSKDLPRDHLRFWTNSANTIAWVAASNEIPTATITAVHKVAPNGFNAGRDTLATDLQGGLSTMGQVDSLTYTSSYNMQNNVYSCSGLQNSTTTATCDGNVAFFAMSAQKSPPSPVPSS